MKPSLQLIRAFLLEDTAFTLVVLSAVGFVLLYSASGTPSGELATSLLMVFVVTAIVEFLAHAKR